MRENDVAALRWDKLMVDLTENAPIIKPGKTARFNRSVQIPIHPQLESALAELPHVNDYVLGYWWPAGKVRYSDRARLSRLFEDCGVRSNETGLIKFNSLRDSFITRMDQNNIPRHATRGVVGQVKDETTDLYSYDLTTAMRIRQLPGLPLPQKDASETKTTESAKMYG